MDERKRALKADRRKHRTERLAGLGRVHCQGFAREVLLAVFRRLGPFADLLDLDRIARVLEHLLLVRQHLLVFGTTEELEVIEHVLGVLGHVEASLDFVTRSFADLDPPPPAAGRTRAIRRYSAAISVGFGTSFQGALAIFQIGELIAMSMSRAKIANPS